MSSGVDSKLVFVGVAGALFGASAAGLALLVANREAENNFEDEDFDDRGEGGNEVYDDDREERIDGENDFGVRRSPSSTGRTPNFARGLPNSVSLSPMDNMPALVGSVLLGGDGTTPDGNDDQDVNANNNNNNNNNNNDINGIFSPTRREGGHFPGRNDISPANRSLAETEFDESVVRAKAEEDPASLKEEEQILLNLLYSIAEDQARREGVVHRGIICNACQRSPVIGVRYKCANCLDYDICESCEPKDHHDPAHVFVKIRVPLPPLSSPRSVLFAPLYVGRRKRAGALSGAGGVNSNAYQPLSWTQLKELVKETQFDHYELESLHEQFFRLCSSSSPSDSSSSSSPIVGISRENFNDCLGTLAIGNNLVVRRLFKFYDQNDDETIDFSEMTKGLSVLIKGSLQDKLPHVFRGYDLDDRGTLSKENLRQMFKAYFSLTVELVKDVVRTCEEDMFNSHYDDAAGKPVSALFTAPIPTELGYPAPFDGGNDSGFPRLDSSLSRSNSGIPSSLSALYLSPMSPMLGAANSDITQNTQIPEVQTPHCRPVGADRGDRLSTTAPNDAETNFKTPETTTTTTTTTITKTPKMEEKLADPKNSTDAISGSISSSVAKKKPFSNDDPPDILSAVVVDNAAIELLEESASQPPPDADRRCTPMWPVIEAMSQDAVAELVDSFFANAGVAQGDRLTYDQFFSLSQSDRSLLAWFEALGTVF